MTDSLQELYCPACGKSMKKIEVLNGKFHVDICLNCGGMWFDNRELKQFDEKHEDISPILEVLKDKTFIKVNQEEIRVCPVCKTKMVKHYSSAKHAVEVDECYNCGGFFLDAGELIQIRNEYETENERIQGAKAEAERLYGDMLRELTLDVELRKSTRSGFLKLLNYLFM